MKKVFALLLGVALLALVFTGCGKESPTDTINKAIQKNAETKTMRTEFDVSFNMAGDTSAMPPELAGMMPLSLGVKGGVDTDSRNDAVKMQGNVEVTGIEELVQGLAGASGEDIDQESMTLLSQMGGVLSDIEFVVVDKNAYVKIAGTWYETGDLGSSMDSLGGLGSLGSLGGMGTGSLDGTSTGAGDVDANCYKDAMKDPSKMSADKLFGEIQEMSEEKIDGVDTRHFKTTIDFNKAMAQMATIARDCGDAEAAAGMESGSADISSFFKKTDMEMWIDKDSNMRQVKLMIELDPVALASMSGDTGTDSTGDTAQGLESISLNMSFKMSKFDEDMNITKPSGEILKIEDLMNNPMFSGLLGGMMGSSGLDDVTGGSSSGSTITPTTGTTSSYAR